MSLCHSSSVVINHKLLLSVHIFIISCYLDHVVIWAYEELDATQLLKYDLLKADAVKPVSILFEPHEPPVILAEHGELTLVVITFI